MIAPPKRRQETLSPATRRRLVQVAAFLPLALAVVVWTRNVLYIEPSKWFNPGLDLVGGVSAVYEADWSTTSNVAKQWTREQILQASREILVDRLDAKGLEGAEIRVAPSESSLHIDIPNVSDPAAVFDIIGKTGKLEFRSVLKDPSATPAGDTAESFDFHGTQVRLGPPVFTGDQLDPRKLKLLSPEPGATGDAAFYRIAFGFQPAIEEQWNAYALHHKGERLAIVLDRDIRALAKFEESISGRGDQWVLAGKYDLQGARDHHLLLKHGQLPVNLRQVQLSLIGASLGESFRRDAFRGFAWASVALILTLCFLYAARPWLLAAAIAALAALALGFAAGLSYWQMRLTIVAIAGFILTLGMGIDSTVIILESLRESLRRVGARRLTDAMQMQIVRTSYKPRFERPILLHANVTNIIGVVVLLWSPPLEPFALVTILGIVLAASNIFLTREMLLATRRTYANTLPNFPTWTFRSFSFERWRVPGTAFCLVVALTGLAFLLTVGTRWQRLELGSDFRPGTEILLRVPRNVDSDRLVTAAATQVAGEWKAQLVAPSSGQESDPRTTYRLTTTATGLGATHQRMPDARPAEGKTGPPADRQIEPADPFVRMLADFRRLSGEAGGNLEIKSVLEVGPAIAAGRLRQCALFVSLAVLAVVFYMMATLRIGGYCALGLFLASVHDVLAMLAVLGIAGFPITYAVVGAILTIVGYSVNDSIILLARIRQVRDDGAAQGVTPPVGVVGAAIKETYSRTMTTGLTTAVPMTVLFFAGGDILRGFSLTVLCGVVAGTLSSFFIVAPMTMKAYASRRRVVPESTESAQELSELLDRRASNLPANDALVPDALKKGS